MYRSGITKNGVPEKDYKKKKSLGGLFFQNVIVEIAWAFKEASSKI